LAGEGGKKSDPTVPIIIGIGILLLVLVFGGCNGINLPVYNPGGGYNGSHGSHYDGGCDREHDRHRYRSRECGGGEGDDRDRGYSGHERRHHPRGTETPDAANR
jgi:hypothetical protein